MSTAPRILVAEDEPSVRTVVTRALESTGATVCSFDSGTAALEALHEGHFDLAVVDIRLPGLSGLDLLSNARERGIQTPFLVMTAETTMTNAIEAMKRGAFDYLTKPFDVDELTLLSERALEMSRLTQMVESLKGELRPRYEPGEGLVGRTPVMQEIYKTIGQVAPTDATVLIRGESGTGKELIARALHFHSGRTGAFIAVNCAAIPAALLESELFGHERGAFTGAVERRVGTFELADRGTLFFDEIAEMPSELQSKVLRAIQEKEFTRLGGRETLQSDVRIVAATNRDLEELVRARVFREDLYFRLNVVPIIVPPLRDRLEDLPVLVEHFFGVLHRDHGIEVSALTADAEAQLRAHDWPGNVRELENALVRASVLAKGRTLTAADLDLSPTPAAPRGVDPSWDEIVRARIERALGGGSEIVAGDLHSVALSWIERPLIDLVLDHTGGNQVRAAEVLGINRNTLRKKISALGLSRKG